MVNPSPPTTLTLHRDNAGLLPYAAAYERQLALHDRVLSGEFPHGAIMLVEHPPVITMGRRIGTENHLFASPEFLAQRGVELSATDRGGDITFHGPGQLVAYPIIPLNTYRLNLHSYMRLMEEAVIRTLAAYGLIGERSTGATGVWIDPHSGSAMPADLPTLAKICAMGIKVRRWITLHGLALNVTTDLSYFDLINPCGLSRPVTSMQQLLPIAPPLDDVADTLTNQFETLLAQCPA